MSAIFMLLILGMLLTIDALGAFTKLITFGSIAIMAALLYIGAANKNQTS